MAKQTIIKKWSEDTNNKYALNEDMVKMGIERMSPIISNQLNSVANRADTFIDLLQRCSAWNVDKTYQIGDICMVSVYYKRASDTTHKYYIMFLLSTQADNKNIPLINAGATSFTRNDDLTTPCFTITANVDTLMLSGFVNAGWAFCDSTCGDLTNCVNLSVSDVANFKGNTSIEGVVNALSNLNVSGNASLNGNTTITGASAFNGNVTLNGALNTATTPDINAKDNEIVTANWARRYLSDHSRYKEELIRSNFIQDISFQTDTTNKILVKIPLEFIRYATNFAFRIELDNGYVYLSNPNFDMTTWIMHSHYNDSLTSDAFVGMFNPLQYVTDNVANVLNYTGQLTINNANTDFEYTIRIGTKGQVVGGSNDDNMKIVYMEISSFQPNEDVNGKIYLILY